MLVGNIIGDPRVLDPWRSLFTHVAHVPTWEMPKIYRSASVFVLPTIVEGMGLVVLEAMASGIPAIVTANGPGDIVRDGIVVPTQDHGAIHSALRRLYDDPALARSLGISARERALEFSWDAYCERVDEVLSGYGRVA